MIVFTFLSFLAFAPSSTAAAPSIASHPSTPLIRVDQPITPSLTWLALRASPENRRQLQVELFWLNRSPINQPDPLRLTLFDAAGTQRGELVESPNYGYLPVTRWAENEIVRDLHRFDLAEDLTPGEYRLELRWPAAAGPVSASFGVGAPGGREPVLGPPSRATSIDFGGMIRLVGHGWEILRRRPLTMSEVSQPLDCRASLRGGDLIRLQLDFQGLEPLRTNYTVFSHLVDREGRAALRQDYQPDSRLAPTSAWIPGRIVADRRILRLPDDLAPGLYNLRVGLYQLDPSYRIAPLTVGQSADTSVALDRLKVGPARPIADPPQASRQGFGDALTLLGYQTRNATRDRLAFDLVWQSDRPTGTAYTLFLHILDATGRVVAQQDQPVGREGIPTDCGAPGERSVDQVQVVPREPLPPGRYSVRLGLYDPVSLQRLPLRDGTGDALRLTEVNLD